MIWLVRFVAIDRSGKRFVPVYQHYHADQECNDCFTYFGIYETGTLSGLDHVQTGMM